MLVEAADRGWKWYSHIATLEFKGFDFEAETNPSEDFGSL